MWENICMGLCFPPNLLEKEKQQKEVCVLIPITQNERNSWDYLYYIYTCTYLTLCGHRRKPDLHCWIRHFHWPLHTALKIFPPISEFLWIYSYFHCIIHWTINLDAYNISWYSVHFVPCSNYRILQLQWNEQCLAKEFSFVQNQLIFNFSYEISSRMFHQ